MVNLFSEAVRVYADEGITILLMKGATKVFRPAIGEKKANALYYNINNILDGRSINNPYLSINGANIIGIQTDGCNTFFGYYDHTPFGPDNEKVLFNRTKKSLRPVEGSDVLELCYFDIKNSNIQKFGETQTWNWQKGCRLMWYPNSRNGVIYNKLVDGQYGSVVQNVVSKEILKKFNQPIYDIDPNGDYALSINYSRLERLHFDYGYVNIPDKTEGSPAPSNDGIYRLDLKTGKKELILTLEQIARATQTPSDVDSYVMNIMINPIGSKFIFLHRYHKNGQRKTNLLCATPDGNNIKVLQKKDEASHQYWHTDRQLISMVNRNNTSRRSDMMLYDTHTGDKSILDKVYFDQDTHPSVSPVNKNLLVGDTYPDSCGKRTLYIDQINSEGSIKLGSFYGPVINNIKRDLHPRWDRKGRYICIDAPRPDNRQSMFIIDTGDIQDF